MNLHKILSLADDLKAAATASLKKCATMLGGGLSLYGAKQLKDSASNTRDKHAGNVTPLRRGQSIPFYDNDGAMPV